MIMLCCFNASMIVDIKTVQSHTEEVPYPDLKFHKRKAQKSVSNLILVTLQSHIYKCKHNDFNVFS